MKLKNRAGGIVLVVGCAHTVSFAQSGPNGGFLLTSSNTVSPSNPSTTVELWAWFDYIPGRAEMFAGTETNIRADEGMWSNVTYQFPIIPPPGVIVGTQVINLVASQLHAPPLGIYANPANPILLFTMDWSTTTFDTRTVPIETFDTQVFAVYINQQGAWALLPQSSIFEGSAVIKVVPAPGALAPFAIAGMAAVRRRR